MFHWPWFLLHIHLTNLGFCKKNLPMTTIFTHFLYGLHHYIVWHAASIMAQNALVYNNAVFIHLFRKITQKSTPCSQHRDTQSDVLTHICENMQSDRTDCNQTLAKHKHSNSHFLSLSHTHTPHTHTHRRSGPVQKRFVILSAGATPPKQEKMIVCCSLSMHSHTHVPRNVKGKLISPDWLR